MPLKSHERSLSDADLLSVALRAGAPLVPVLPLAVLDRT